MANRGSAARDATAAKNQSDVSDDGRAEDDRDKDEEQSAESGAVTPLSFITRRTASPREGGEPPSPRESGPQESGKAAAKQGPNTARSEPDEPGTGSGGKSRQGKGKGRRARQEGGGAGKAGNKNQGEKKKQQGKAGEASPRPAQKPPQQPAAAAQQQTDVRPIAKPAEMKRRHWGLIASFVLLVLVPFAAAVSYLYMVAEDQYRSTSGFTVRSQEDNSANDLLGGIMSFAGGTVASDSDILYEFIQSSEMVDAVNAQIDLREHYSVHWPRDWFFSIWPDASQEDLIGYWNRMVGVSYDSGTGLIEVEVRAFDAETAQRINQAIVNESQTRINELNRQAREDAMRYALADLDDAVELLKNAREAMTNFRLESQIVDPETDIQTRMGVMTSLQQQLAQALVEYDLLRGTTTATDPRLKDAAQRIEVIRERIAIERQNFATSSTETGGVSQDYPSLIAEYERLTVDREYAEEFYFASLTALEAARDEANRQSRYLATYIQPTRAQDAEYPQRSVLSGLTGLFLLLAWSILALIYYSIRDRS